MGKSAKNITVKASAGRNEVVDPVVKLEDLLQRMQRNAVPKAARGRAAATVDAGAARQLLAELEARLRGLRGAAPPAKKR